TEAPLPRERPQGSTILGTAEVDSSLARRRAEGVDHLGRQRQDDVVGNGEDRQVGQIDGGRRGLAGLGAQFLRKVADIVRVAAADRGDGVDGLVKGVRQRRYVAAGNCVCAGQLCI